MEHSIKGIVRRFINELTKLEDEPLNQQSIHKLSCRIREMEESLVSITYHLSKIKTYEEAKQDYAKAIDYINKFIDNEGYIQ